MSHRCAIGVLALCVGAMVVQAAAGSAAVTVASPRRASAVQPVTPERLFAVVAPGMLKIVSDCTGGLFVGSGFLVGPRTMITALHVLQPPGGGSCKTISVKQEGSGGAALVGHFDAYKADDLAVAHLSAPISGFFFGITPKQPSIGARVIGLGYSLGNPLSFNQGTVVGFADVKQVSYMEMNLLGGHGSSGGPIVDLQGRVVGLTQRGATNGAVGVILSINFGTVAPGGEALCQDVAKSSPSTLCGSVKPSVVGPGSSSSTKTATRPVLARTTPPTLAAGSITARAYNSHTIGDKANHIPSPPVQSGDSVEVPEWNGYLRLALLANQDPYGRKYSSTYVRCWSAAKFGTAAKSGTAGNVFSSGTGPLGFHEKGSAWVNVPVSTCAGAAKAARGDLTQTNVVALASILHETFNRQGIDDEADLTCLGAIGVWEAVNRHVGQAPADRAWALLLDWYSSHLENNDLVGFNTCVSRFNTDWNG